uniref:NADH-ubiquinone oxidoreductase chain 6 n=1 Tax=Curculionoidea sp. 27 KM-2017 TaxID=2219411 RepID=A0A346RKP6_9CUCU|nr:NADH dehydrogenase subunit 6 [Curculionoidea sp. 27 KM-2017]
MQIIFYLNLILSLMFMFMNHPLSLGCILLMQTIMISLVSGYLYMNFWFSYILFLIMIGGMLVMFIYMTSIASNEKFKMPKKMLYLCMLSILLFFPILMFNDSLYSNLINMLSINNIQFKLIENSSLMKFFNYPNMLMLIFLMVYLLITLIAVVKITGKIKGTLRQKK